MKLAFGLRLDDWQDVEYILKDQPKFRISGTGHGSGAK